jgi:predicted amidohydrolase
MEFLDDWASYQSKLTAWVSEAATQKADLLVFPEYGAMELATLVGAAAAADREGSLQAVSDLIGQADSLHSDLATKYRVHILAASAPVFDQSISERPVNRARLFSPTGGMVAQDKQIMTRFEREEWLVEGGAPLSVIETGIGRIGVLICYDSEFPLLARQLSEADIILVPSCTEALAGYSRVRIGSMARALEQQCVTVMASTVGSCPWGYAVEENTGMGGIFCPPDTGFPSTGILAEGTLNRPGWTYAEVDVEKLANVRTNGVVLNRRHWIEQPDGATPAPILPLC